MTRHDAIHDSLTDNLSGLDLSKAEQAAMMKNITGGITMKIQKKLTVAFALTAALLLALTGVGVALTLNIFDLFGQKDQRFAQIAPQSVIATDAPVVAQSDKLGTSTASITNMYYDGDSLLVGYMLTSATFIEPFAPTAEQLSNMTPHDSAYAVAAQTEQEQRFSAAYEQAKRDKTPFGMVKYTVSVADHSYSDDGIDLGTWNETDDHSEEGALLCIRDYDDLPQAARGRDSLTIRIGLYQSATYLYFDGQNAYAMSERIELPPMTATARRASGETISYTGVGTLQDAQVRVTADVSAVHWSVNITPLDGALPELPENLWYDMVLDCGGSDIEASSFEITKSGDMLFLCNGDGALPQADTITIYILIVGDEEGTVSFPIELGING